MQVLVCLSVCVCLRLAGWKWTPPTPSLPPSGFPVLCYSNWKRLLINQKLWLFTVTFPSSSFSSYLPPLGSFSKVCPLSLSLTFGVVMLWVFESAVFLLLQLSNRVSPHQNSWATSLSRPTLNRPPPATWWMWDRRNEVTKGCAEPSVCFCYLKVAWRTARLSGCWVLLCSKVVGQGTKGCLWGDAGLGGLVKHH